MDITITTNKRLLNVLFSDILFKIQAYKNLSDYNAKLLNELKSYSIFKILFFFNLS